VLARCQLTPATAAGCDGALVPAVAAPDPPAPVPPAVAPLRRLPSLLTHLRLRQVVRPEGRAKLDDLVSKIKDVNLEVIIPSAIPTGSVPGVQPKLSVRRAEAVKAYLVSGIERTACTPKARAKQPSLTTTPRPAKNRRVEIKRSVPAPTSDSEEC
jgi:OOP family OmpA-OmpF porin